MQETSGTGDGTLAAEIQRKADEIDGWPEWAKPYDHKVPSPPPSSDRPSSASVPGEADETEPSGRHAR
jgi:hypothetical protein